MPEYSVVRKQGRNEKDVHFEIECKPLKGEDLNDHRAANLAATLVNHDLRTIQNAKTFTPVNKHRENSLEILGRILPKNDAGDIFQAALNKQEGASIEFTRGSGDIYNVTKRNF